MELSVRERLMVLGLMPKEGSYTNLKLIREAREALSFSDEENSELKFREETIDGGKVLAWEANKERSANIALGNTVIEIIKKELKKLDDEDKLTEEHVPIYEKFFELGDPK